MICLDVSFCPFPAPFSDLWRKTLLDVFNLLGGQGELVMAYRRKLVGMLS